MQVILNAYDFLFNQITIGKSIKYSIFYFYQEKYLKERLYQNFQFFSIVLF